MADNTLTFSLTADVASFMTQIKSASANVGAFFKEWSDKEIKVSANTADLVKAGAAVRQLMTDARAAAAKSDIPITVRAAGIQQVQAEIKGLVDTNTKVLASMKATGQEGSSEYRELLKATKETRAETLAYDKALEDIEAQLGKTATQKGSGLLSGAINFAAISAGVGVAADAMKELSEPAVKLDTVTAQMRTLGPEAKAMSGSLRSAAIEMSKELPIAASDIQQTMFDAVASGVKGGQSGLKEFAEVSGKLAIGGGAEIGEATSLIAGQLNAYGASSDQANRYADVFFNTVNFGVTSVKELSSTLANVVPTAAGMGLEIENVGAAVALMTQKGIPAAQSTTKLNQMLIELQKPTGALIPILKAAGVSLESLKNDDLPTTLGKVKTAMDATGKSAVQVFGSSEAAAAYQTLTGDLTALQQTYKDVATTTGSTDNAYAEMAGSIDVQTKQIKSTVQAFATDALGILPNAIVATGRAFVELAPSATALGGMSTLAMNSVSAFGKLGKGIKEAGGAVKFVTEKAPALAKFGGTIADSAKGAMDLGKMLLTRALPGTIAQTGATVAQTGATVGATFATRALSLAMTALPIFAIVAGVGLLVAALAGVFSGAEDMSEAMEGAGGAIEGANKTIADTAATDKQQNELKKLGDEYDSLKGKTDPASMERFKVVADQLATAAPGATVGLAEMGEAAQINTTIVDSFADSQLRANEAMRQGAAATLGNEMRDLGESTAEAKEDLADLLKEQEARQKRIAELETARKAGGFANRNVGQIIDAEQKALNETTAKVGELNKQIQEGEKLKREGVVSGRKLGQSWDEVARSQGVTVEEAKKYVAEQRIIEQKAYDDAKAASALTNETFDAVEQAKKLGEQWAANGNEIAGAFETAKNATLQLRLMLKEGNFEGLDVVAGDGTVVGMDAATKERWVTDLMKQMGVDRSAAEAELTKRVAAQAREAERKSFSTAKGLDAKMDTRKSLEDAFNESMNPTKKTAKTESIDDAFKATLEGLERLKQRRIADAKEQIRDEQGLKVRLGEIDTESARERLTAAAEFVKGQATAQAELRRVLEQERDVRAEIIRNTIADDAEEKTRLEANAAEFEKLITSFGGKDIGAGIQTATKDFDSFRVAVSDTSKALTDLYKGWQEAQAKADAESLARSLELFDQQFARLREIEESELSLLPDSEKLARFNDALGAIRDKAFASLGTAALPEEEELKKSLGRIAVLAADTLNSPEVIAARNALAESMAAIQKETNERLFEAERNELLLSAEDVERDKLRITREGQKRLAVALGEYATVGEGIEKASLDKRAELYRAFGDAVKGFYENIGDTIASTMEEARAEFESASGSSVDLLAKATEALRKSLEEGLITAREFVRGIYDLAALPMDEAFTFWDEWKAGAMGAIKAVGDMFHGLGDTFRQTIGTTLSNSLTDAFSGIERSSEEVKAQADAMKTAVVGTVVTMAAETTATLASMIVKGDATIADYANLLLDMVDAAGTAATVMIFTQALATPGNLLTNIALFIATLSGFKLAVAAAKAGLSKFGDGGLVGGGEQLALLNDKGKPEYVINGDAVQQYGTNFLDAVNKGRLVVNSAGKLTREAAGNLPRLKETDLRTLRNLADAFSGIDVSNIVTGLDEPFDMRRALQQPRTFDSRAEFAAMVDKALSIQVAPDPHTKAIAEATAASVFEERMMREEIKKSDAKLARMNARMEEVAQNTRSSNWQYHRL